MIGIAALLGLPPVAEAVERIGLALALFESQRQRAPQTRKLERELSQAFRAHGREMVKELRAYRHQFEESLAPRDWERAFSRALRRVRALYLRPVERSHEDALEAGANAVLATIGGPTLTEFGLSIRFDMKHPSAVAWMRENGAARVAGIHETTRGYLNTLLTQAVDEGWSYDRTAKAITARFREFASPSPLRHIQCRAHLIAVTEVGDAYEHGTLLAAQQLDAAGLGMEKSWLTVGDQRVSQMDRDNEAAGWKGIDEDFPSGHQRPLSHPGCRCTLLTRRKQETR